MAATEVMLVEADDLAAKVERFWLERAGYRVQRQVNGEGALAAASSSRPDVVVSAVLLPDIDGWTLVTRLREEAGEELPAILVSVLERHRPEGFVGEVEYLTKPVDGTALVRAVRRELRRAGHDGRLPRLLLAHDDERRLHDIGQRLEDAGFAVTEALGADEACVLAELAPFEAVLVAADDPERYAQCLRAIVDGRIPWLRFGAPPPGGEWDAVVSSLDELPTAVEKLVERS